MSKSRIIGFIGAFILIGMGLMFRFKITELTWGTDTMFLFCIALEGAWLVNILGTRFIGKVRDDMKLVETSGVIMGYKGLSRVLFIINILIVAAILAILITEDFEIKNIVGLVNCIFMLNLITNIAYLYIGNKYAIIQGCLVKLDDIESVTKNEVIRKSNPSRTEFKVRTKKGKFYIVSCDKRMEDNIEEISKRINMGSI